ncbi:MAG TPA: sulfite exporter TauE/SafE family protein [Caulobacteraceae bacterium]|jgi:hypothetical protein|nr:sulfite exporter TauE/SafE family protein [Caulobacteraceae bacterium]
MPDLAHGPAPLIILFVAALWAGAQNALAGGGSFITLPALMFTGMDARAANITSTVALFPGQVATGLTGRKLVEGAEGLSFRMLVILSLAGGVVGALLLLSTPASFFALLVPWLVLFATGVFTWGSFFPRKNARVLGPWAAGAAQFGIAVYGGYFGGGIGFLMLAALTLAGQAVRTAGATKNVLAGVMNASAVVIFLFSHQVKWEQAAIACAGALVGGVLGGVLLRRVNEKLLRGVVVAIGLVLTVGLFVKAYAG